MIVEKLLNKYNNWKNKIFYLFVSLFIIFFFLPKGSAIEYISIIILLFCCLNFNELKQNPILKNKIFILTILLLAVQLCSSFFAFDIKDALHEWRKQYLLVIVFGMVIINNYRLLTFKSIYRIMSISLFIVGIYYFYEVYNIEQSLNLFKNNFFTIRDATFVIPIILPFVIYGMFLFYKDKLFFLFSIMGIILTFLIVFYSGSRGAYVSYFLEISIFLIYLIYMIIKNKKYYLVFLISVLILTLIQIINFNNVLFEKALKRGFSPNGRDVIMHAYIPVVKQNLFFGSGMGQKNMNIRIKKYNIKNRYVFKNINNLLELGYHNRILALVIENGIFAAMLYIFIILLSIKILLNFKKNFFDEQNIISLVFITILIDHYLIRGMVESLDFKKFYFIIFLMLTLYSNLEKLKNENSIHIS